jgi:type VI secretion system protein VasJ
LRRLPGLPELSFADGAPFADAETRAFLANEILPRAAANGPASAGANRDEANALAEARKLVAEGNMADALARLQARADTAATSAQAFRARLDLARLLLESEQPTLAKAIFSGLDEELRARGLEDWDPPLATECLEGYLRCLRALTRAGKNVPEDTMLLYNRLCRLDPVVALRLGF